MIGTNHTNRGTTKLQEFLEEHARSNVLSNALEKSKLKRFNFHESPVAGTSNTFKNEESILNQRSQVSSTPENISETMANVLQSNGQKSKFKNRLTNKPKKVTLSKPSKPLVQTYKSSNHNSTGTSRLERFLKEYSQEASPLSDILNFPNQKNNSENAINPTKNALPNVKNETKNNNKTTRLKRSISMIKNSSLSETSSSSPKSIHRKSTLLEYFKEIKNITGAVTQKHSTSASGSVLTISSFSGRKSCESICGTSNFYCSDEDREGCARTRAWPDINLAILDKEAVRQNHPTSAFGSVLTISSSSGRKSCESICDTSNFYCSDEDREGCARTKAWPDINLAILEKEAVRQNHPTSAFGSVLTISSSSGRKSCESICETSNFYCSDEDREGCARTKAWPDINLAILDKESNKKENDEATNMVCVAEENKRNKYSSPLNKGLNLIKKLDEQYKKQYSKYGVTKASSNSSSSSKTVIRRKCRSQKVDQWLKNNLIQTNDNNTVDFKITSSKSKVKKEIFCRKSSSEISFKTKWGSSRIMMRNKTQKSQRQKEIQNANLHIKESNNKNTITRYFFKNKLVDNKECYGSYSCNFGIKSCTSSNSKEKEEHSAEDIDKFKNTASSLSNLIKNTKPWNDRTEESSKSQNCDKKQNNSVEKLGQNLMKGRNCFDLKPITEKKTQKNLYSSEGFCESMSLETPILKSSDHRKSLLSPNHVEMDSSSLRERSSQKICSMKRAIKDSLKTHCNTKLKDMSSFFNSLCSQPQKLSPIPKRKGLTLSDQRELCPDYYIMKMCGPESAALVKKILNGEKNATEENTFNDNKNEARDFDGTCQIQNSGSQNHVCKIETVVKCLEEDNTNKDTLSDPLSFGSPYLTISENCSQLNKESTLGKGTKSICLNANGFTCHENFYKLPNSWYTLEQAREQDSLETKYVKETNFATTSASEPPINNNVAEPHSAIENFILPEMFSTQGFVDNFQPLEKNGNLNTRLCVDESKNPLNDPFLQKIKRYNVENAPNKNYSDFKPVGFDNHVTKENLQQSQMDVYHARENCEKVKLDGNHNKPHYEELERASETQTQTETFTENIFGTQTETQNDSKKSKKTYNISKDCVLYEDNLLKSLIEDKQSIWKTSRKKRALKRNNSEGSLKYGQSKIKRYKKGVTKIFKIKRRTIRKAVKNYKPPERQIMDKFLKKLNSGFKDESSSNSDSNSKDKESVSTPMSYETDETNSEVLSTGSSTLTDAQKVLRQGINKLSKDKSLLFSKFDDSVPTSFHKYEIVANIERIVDGVLEDFQQGRNPFFRVPKENISNCFFADGRYQIKEPPDYTIVSYKSNVSRQKFNLILFLLNKIKTLIETGTKLTKREIYYQLKILINSQLTTDRALKDISRMLNVGLWALNVTAQKGLVYGNLKLVMSDGVTVNCNAPGTLIPQDILNICEVQSTAYFILVVEKESIFHKLLEENLPNRLTRPFILITGKGFPDLNTQLFLKKLWMVMSIPVFILVDADPDGIAIMLNYRFGSIANAHVSEHLAIPKARWLGVFPSEIVRLSLCNENLTKREISMTQKLLQLPCVQENEKIKKELEKLLEHGIKTGIEGLVKTDTYLSNCYLSWKFFTNNLI